MGIKPCVLFTELGGSVVESLVFYLDINTPRPTYFRGKMRGVFESLGHFALYRVIESISTE